MVEHKFSATKVCRGCGMTKSKFDFLPRNPRSLRSNARTLCRSCERAKNSQMRQKRRVFAPTHPPGSKCEICFRPFDPPGEPQYDHCHFTGLHRGWLCRSCNRMLGAARDSIDVLLNAAAYLRRFQERGIREKLVSDSKEKG